MAVISQPQKKPEWNTGGLNRTEPLPGEKTSGWVVDDEPPSSYFNWLQFYTYEWLEWLNQRFYKGTNQVDLIIEALQPDASGAGGDLTLRAGNALTSGNGGDVTVTAGQAAGANAGGDITLTAGVSGGAAGGSVGITAAQGTAAGGGVTVTAGLATSGAGGDVVVTAGAGSASGGDMTLTAGNAGTSGPGGDVAITAGNGLGGSEGGDVTLTAGNSADTNGGDVELTAGTATGTDRQGGQVDISAGGATGDQGSQINILCAEAGTSGSAARTPETYLSANGGASFKRIDILKYLYLNNASDTTRGAMRIFGKAGDPSAPLAGDVHMDSVSQQLAVHNGTLYQNLNPTVYTNSANAVTGQNPIVASGTTVVLNEVPYGGGISTTAMRHTIPAGALRVGSIIRVRAQFITTDLGGGSSFWSPKVYVGSIGAGPSPYTAPTGVAIFNSFRSSDIWDLCFVECELHVRSLGSPGNVDNFHNALFTEGGTPVRPTDVQSVLNTNTVNNTVAVDVFPAVVTGTGLWRVDCNQFVVDII
jgi:hypothetical protein